MKPIYNILVVDDDPLVRMNLGDVLRMSDYCCETTGDIERAWQLVSQRKFNLLISDHDLPDGSGYDLVLKMIRYQINVPVIYLSANASPSLSSLLSRIVLIKSVLRKPVPDRLLISAVKEAVATNRIAAYPRLIGAVEQRLLLKHFVAY